MQFPAISNKTATDVALLVKVFPFLALLPIKLLNQLNEASVHDCLTPTPSSSSQALHMASTTRWNTAWISLISTGSNMFRCPPLHSKLGAKKRPRPMLSNHCIQSITIWAEKKSKSFWFFHSLLVVSRNSIGLICLHTCAHRWPNIPHGPSPAVW